MAGVEIILKLVLISCFLWKGIVAPAPVFNLQNCEGGCKSQDNCPANSACIPLIGQACGVCLCTVGYTFSNGECVSSGPRREPASTSPRPTTTTTVFVPAVKHEPKRHRNKHRLVKPRYTQLAPVTTTHRPQKALAPVERGLGVPVADGFGQRVPPKAHKSSENNGGDDNSGKTSSGSSGGSEGGSGGGVASLPGPPAVQTTSAAPASSSAAPTVQPTTASGNGGSSNGGSSGGASGESGGGFDCNKYKCDGQLSKDGKDCTDSPPNTVQCPNLAGGGQCMLGSCLRVNSSLSYCMCPYGRQSRTCHVKKTGNCNSADGKMPPDAGETKGKRFRHIRDPENGAVLARHAVDSLSDCVRLCQWATYQQCRSINFGTINGQKTCELLTVWANKESILYQWLKDDSDWTYVCCFK